MKNHIAPKDEPFQIRSQRFTTVQLVMRVRKPKAAYKLVQLCLKKPQGSILTY